MSGELRSHRPGPDASGPAAEPVRRRDRIRSVLFGALRLGIGVALLYVLATTGVLDWAALGGLLDAWPLTALAVACIAVGIGVTAWRLCIVLHPRGFHLGLRASLRLTLIGMFFNVAMPGSSGGDLVRIYYASKGNEGRRAEIVTILLLDRFIGLVALLVYPVVLAPLYLTLLADEPALRAVVGTAAILILLLGLAIWIFLGRGAGRERILRLLARIPGGALIHRAIGTLRSYGSDRRPLWYALLVSLGAHALGMMGFVLLARATVTPTFAWTIFVIVPIGMVVNTVPLTPGGLGVGEAAFAVLFGMVGLNGGPEVLISWRIVTILIGLAGFFFYLKGRRRFVSMARPETGPESAAARSIAHAAPPTGAEPTAAPTRI